MTEETFVGRRRELEQLSGLLAASRTEPVTAMLSGEPGVGKSRLLKRFADLARESGALVLRGSCIELGAGSIPYAPLIEALRLAVKVDGEEKTRLAVGPAWDELADLVLEFTGSRADASGRATPLAEGPQVRVFGAVLQALDHLGADRPVALIFEDLHWADQSTLDLVAYLTRAKTTERAMITCSHRSELPRQHPLRALLSEPDFARRTEQLEVGRFSAGELHEFLTGLGVGAVDREQVRRGFQLSEGNPFFAEQLMRSGFLQEAGAQLPENLNDLMLRRVRKLSQDATLVLQFAAIAARKVGDDLLAAACGLGHLALNRALHECLDEGMLRRGREDDSYSVKHELLRKAVYEDMLPRELRGLHGVMADAIVADFGREPADVGLAVELAHHWERAGGTKDALTAWVRVAEMTAARRAFHEADTHYRRALRLWPGVADAAEAAGRPHERLLAAAADAARWAGRVGDAVDRIQDALGEVVETADPGRAAELYERLADYLWEAGSPDKSAEAYEHALRLIVASGERTALEVRVRAALATVMLRKGRYREGLKAARVAVKLAEEVHAEAERGRALNTAGTALALSDEPDEAERLVQEAKAIAERTEHLEDLLRAYANLGLVREHRGDLHGSVEILLEGHARAVELGLSGARQTGVLANNAAVTMSLIGRWDKAVEMLEDFLMEQPPVQQTLYMRLTLAELYGWRGRFSDVRRLLDQVRPHASADPRFLGSLYVCEAEMHIWDGDQPRAEAVVWKGFQAVSGSQNDLVRMRLCAVGLRASADRLLSGSDPEGSTNRAAVWAAETRQIRGRSGAAPEIDALGRLCDAELARARGHGTPALWSEAAQAWDDLGRPYPTAYARWRETEAAVAAGDRDTAWTSASEALMATEPLKAEPLHAAVAAFVAAHRLDPGPSAQDVPVRPADRYKLTRREREVLRLVIEGYTNRDIAEALFIVRGTVDLHVHRILTKLGVPRRTDAITLARNTGLAEDLDGPP